MSDAAEAAQPLPMAMWVWNARLVIETRGQDQLFKFCRSHRVDTLYLSAYDLRAPMDEIYRQFNRRAHEAGIRVYALAGDPRWGKPRYHHIPLAWVDQVRALNQKAQGLERFDGIHTDIEVYLLSKSWRERPEFLLGGYLDLTRQIAQKVREDSQRLLFDADVPFWFDDDTAYRILWNGVIKPPSHHVMDHVDGLTVLAYRNYSEGRDGTMHLVMLELDYAQRIGKQVVVGQETQQGLIPPYVTFGGTSCERLHEELEKMQGALGSKPSFGGFAIHHYESFKELCEK